MLLSDETTAEWLSANFVLSWEMVREPAKVSIDFGSGKKLERTLAGNTAFYLTTSDGTVFDVFPGVYSPQHFKSEVEKSMPLWNQVKAVPARDRAKVVRDWHIASLSTRITAERARVSGGKAFIESPILKALGVEQLRWNEGGAEAKPNTTFAMYAMQFEDVSKFGASAINMRDRLLNNEKLSEEDKQRRIVDMDSRTNVISVRPAVHLMFRDVVKGTVKPSDLTKTVYGQILHIDIDDPYLGLADNLLPGTLGG